MIAVTVLLAGCVMVLCFILGALFCRHLMVDAREQAQYDALRNEYYRLAGVRTSTDPRPYVPPRSHNRMLPGMNQIGDRLREGKRGTLIWRPGDRKNAG